MGVVVTRGLLALLVFCSLSQHGTTQDILNEFALVDDERTMYEIRKADSVKTLTNSDDVDYLCGSDNIMRLAVFESVEEYKTFIAKLKSLSVDIDKDYYIGIARVDNRPELRTMGGRKPPIVNFEDSQPTDGDRCVAIDLQTANSNERYADSPWKLATCTLAVDDRYICMTAEDNCGSDCPESADPREEESCFWNPQPESIATYAEARDLCQKNGGKLANLLDEGDIDDIKDADVFTNDDPESIYWLGLKQEPGKGSWAWGDDSYADLPDEYWAEDIYYGSSLVDTPQVGIFNPAAAKGDGEVGLTNILDYSDPPPWSIEAGVICEDVKTAFCLKNSPKIENGEKEISDGKVVYECKEGFEFEPEESGETPDEEIERECTCNLDELTKEIPKCKRVDPCDRNPCGWGSYCIPTPYSKDSHICLCYDGLRKNKLTNRCEVIGPLSSYTITLSFYLFMEYDDDFNNPAEEEYDQFREALKELGESIYADAVNLQSFRVQPSGGGRIHVELVLGLFIPADITRLSVMAYKFASYVRGVEGRDGFKLNNNYYQYTGAVYFQTLTMTQQVLIETPCSVFEAVGQCNNNPCQVQGEIPVCNCLFEDQGPFCEGPRDGPESMRQTEVALIVAIAVLFVLVLAMPIVFCCCMRPRPNPLGGQPDEFYQPGPTYRPSPAPRYITKPAGLRNVRMMAFR